MAVATDNTIVCQLQHCSLIRYPSWLKPDLVDHPHGKGKEKMKTIHKESIMEDIKLSTNRKSRKRKRQRTLNEGEELQYEYHQMVRSFLVSCYEKLMEIAKKLGHFTDTHSNNVAVSVKESDVDFTTLCTEKVDTLYSSAIYIPPIWNVTETNEVDIDVIGKIVNNKTDNEVLVRAFNESFLLPLGSSFLLSDISQIDLLTKYTGTLSSLYHVIVIDPPWENRSAIRGKKYQWLNNEDLLQLPIPELASNGCLVAVWVTNKRRLVHWVKDTLFPYWNVQYEGEWIWLKVTTDGDLVFDLDSPHKKPYEILLIGRVQPLPVSYNSVSTDNSELHEIEEVKRTDIDGVHGPDSSVIEDTKLEPGILHTGSEYKKPKVVDTISTDNEEHKILDTGSGVHLDPFKIPKQYMFMCVQSVVHSQKPYIGDILKQYVRPTSTPTCLELFARNLTPGWTSWGNEVLKFQSVRDLPVYK